MSYKQDNDLLDIVYDHNFVNGDFMMIYCNQKLSTTFTALARKQGKLRKKSILFFINCTVVNIPESEKSMKNISLNNFYGSVFLSFIV